VLAINQLLTNTTFLSLRVQGSLRTSTPAKLAATAFPALQRVELEQVSLNWDDLHALAAFSQLSSLSVDGCALPETAPADNPLAAIASLKELHVTATSSLIARSLTQLTSLHLHSGTDHVSQLIMHRLNGMQQLQQLDLQGSDNKLTAVLVAQLFSAVPHLKDVTLGNIIKQQAFDALLAHATQLTRLTCRRLELSEDRSQSACSWKELLVTHCSCTARTLAYLPLHSLSRACLDPYGRGNPFEIPSACPYLYCWVYSEPTLFQCTPAEIQAALTNLGTCPAWQDSGESVHVDLLSSAPQASLDSVEERQSIAALAAVAQRKVHLTTGVWS
jgi:hypothetical protein